MNTPRSSPCLSGLTIRTSLMISDSWIAGTGRAYRRWRLSGDQPARATGIIASREGPAEGVAARDAVLGPLRGAHSHPIGHGPHRCGTEQFMASLLTDHVVA